MDVNKTIKLTNEFCNVLTHIEMAGMPVDMNALHTLECETVDRIQLLECEMMHLAKLKLGDTPINLHSHDDLSTLLFSRKVISKSNWKKELGFYVNQNKFEKLRLKTSISYSKFIRLVKSEMNIVYKTEKIICRTCYGKRKIKIEGKGNRAYKCLGCSGAGVEYAETDKIGGLKITPKKQYISSSGFSTSTDVIEELLKDKKINKTARRFLLYLDEYRKLNSYLETGIRGIKNAVFNSILHPTFNQATTSTGRLSSTKPNVQNFPKGKVFPIKKVFISRFQGGLICDADLGQLEFRVAAELADDDKARQDIINGLDIHRLSASKIFNKPESEVTADERQQAKPETFAPLYGASRDWGLLERYQGIKAWHDRLITEAVQTKRIVLPSGRFYEFPYIKRTAYGCNQQTKVKNYPVQGFATADIVPAIIIELFYALQGYQSYIMSTIHDSVLIDIHPEEKERVLDIVTKVMNNGNEIVYKRFGVRFQVPLVSDIKVGKNAYDVK